MERMTRTELDLTYRFAAFLSELLYLNDDFKDRLSLVDNGQKRLDRITEDTTSLLKDVVATMPENQQRQFRNATHDYKIELVAKMKPNSQNVLMTKEQAKDLVDLAQDRCHGCVENGDDIENCALFKLLETITPLETYDTFVCPYALARWE